MKVMVFNSVVQLNSSFRSASNVVTEGSVSFQVITASEFHPRECSLFVYSSSKGTIRLCDMRQAALCDSHAKSKPNNLKIF